MNHPEADKPNDDIIEISDFPGPSINPEKDDEFEESDPDFTEAKTFLDELEGSDVDKESLTGRRLDEAVDLLRKTNKELEEKNEKIGDLESTLRSYKKRFRSAVLSAVFLSLFSSAMMYRSLKNGKEQNTDSKHNSIAEVNTSLQIANPDLIENTDRQKILEPVQVLESLREEVEKSNEKIGEIDAWIALQTEEYWKNKGLERKDNWNNYLQQIQQQIISIQEEMIRELNESKSEDGR